VKTARIAKIAGLSFAGFVAASIVADKVNLNPLSSQIAGFAGAFLALWLDGDPLQQGEVSARAVRSSQDRTGQEHAE
jgi:uncharacterized membrane protein YeaQ/YmgE (transglycosylase-associated protein family)